jgi:hypothetical protein
MYNDSYCTVVSLKQHAPGTYAARVRRCLTHMQTDTRGTYNIQVAYALTNKTHTLTHTHIHTYMHAIRPTTHSVHGRAQLGYHRVILRKQYDFGTLFSVCYVAGRVPDFTAENARLVQPNVHEADLRTHTTWLMRDMILPSSATSLVGRHSSAKPWNKAG